MSHNGSLTQHTAALPKVTCTSRNNMHPVPPLRAFERHGGIVTIKVPAKQCNQDHITSVDHRVESFRACLQTPQPLTTKAISCPDACIGVIAHTKLHSVYTP
jgi:hypothetical protein